MKKILSIICLLCLPVFVATAAPKKGALKVHLSDNSSIAISLNGKLFKKYGSALTVGDLPKGSHSLTIYTYAPDKEGKKQLKPIYNKDVRVYKDEITILVLDVYSGKASISYQDWNIANEPQAQEVKQARRMVISPVNNNAATTPVAAPAETYDDFNATEATIIGPDDWGKLQHSVEGTVTDMDKMKVIKDGLKDKSVSTAQVASIMQWCNFEESKLSIAKWCYNHTVDKNNYSILKTNLTSKDHITSFDAFLKSRS